MTGIFLHPSGGLTPLLFYVHPRQFDLVTPRGVKSWTDAENMEIVHEIWSFGSQENHLICCHQMSDFKGKMHQIQFRLGWLTPPMFEILKNTLCCDIRSEGVGWNRHFLLSRPRLQEIFDWHIR